MNKLALRLGLLVLVALLPFAVSAAKLKPYSLAQKTSGNVQDIASEVRKKLEANGFSVVGSYQPYETAKIFIITNNELKRVASKTRFGGFGAVLKVAVTAVGKEIQISYNNPSYVGLAYNMNSRLEGIKARLKKTLGYMNDFGGGDGVEEGELPDYNYTFGLEGFGGFFEFVDHGSYANAIKKVENGLVTNNFGITKIFRVDIPGKQQTIFGLGMNADVNKQPFLNDTHVMGVVDHQPLRGSAHLPYEIMVHGSKVIAMHPHFRLAISFPDLRMFGEHSFGRLMDLPYVYEEFVTQAVGGKWPPEDDDF